MTNTTLSLPNAEALQPFMQPYVGLTQRNMQLFTSFSASPEMASLWLKNGQKMFSQAVQGAASGKTSHGPAKIVEQVQDHMVNVGQSKAFASLLQGLMQSHLQFLTDLAQTNMAALGQMPAKVMEHLQQSAINGPAAASAPEDHPLRAKRKAH
jgi:hypothetical protein